MDLAHPCLWVSDMDRAIDFYAALGLERQWSFELDGVENVYLGDSEGVGEVQLRHDPERTTPIAPNRADVDHIGFVLDDADAVEQQYEAALSAGGSEVTAPVAVDAADAFVAFVEDPEGYTLEFFTHVEE